MQAHVAILEDDTDRLIEMKQCLDEILPEYQHCFFDNAQEMVSWLTDNLATCVLISLDHDLPIIQYRMGQRVNPGTGRFVADFLAQQSPTCPIIIHSRSGPDGEGMARPLREANWPTARVQSFGDFEWIRKIWLPQVQQYVKEGWIFSHQ